MIKAGLGYPAGTHQATVVIDDKLARDLMKKADEDGCPIAGRRFEIRQVLGDLYGATVYAGDSDKGLALVCRPGSAVTYTASDL